MPEQISLSPLTKFGPIADYPIRFFYGNTSGLGFHALTSTTIPLSMSIFYSITSLLKIEKKKILTKITINVNLEEVGAAMEGNKFFFLTRETFVHTNI